MKTCACVWGWIVTGLLFVALVLLGFLAGGCAELAPAVSVGGVPVSGLVSNVLNPVIDARINARVPGMIAAACSNAVPCVGTNCGPVVPCVGTNCGPVVTNTPGGGCVGTNCGPIADTETIWYGSAAEAVDHAIAQNKRVIVLEIGKTTCPYCKVLKNNVVFQPELNALILRQAVLWYAEWNESGTQDFDAYCAGAYSIPDTAVLTVDIKTKTAKLHSYQNANSFPKDEQGFINAMRDNLISRINAALKDACADGSCGG